MKLLSTACSFSDGHVFANVRQANAVVGTPLVQQSLDFRRSQPFISDGLHGDPKAQSEQIKKRESS